MLGALDIRDAAEGVAVWKTGFPMTGRDGTAIPALAVWSSLPLGFRGSVDDFDMCEALAAAAKLEGKVLVLVIEVLGFLLSESLANGLKVLSCDVDSDWGCCFFKNGDWTTGFADEERGEVTLGTCLLYTSPSPRDRQKSRMPSSA